MNHWSTPSHYAPSAVMRAMDRADYKYYDAEKMELICEGHVDWCHLADICQDEYRIMCDDAFVRCGFIEVDKPQREGRGMFIVSHQSELLQNEAYPAAQAGLWWHIQSRSLDFEKTLEMHHKILTHSTMSLKERDSIFERIEAWRGMFPGDTRIDDFHSDFVLDMLTRRRVWRRESTTSSKQAVYFDRVEA